MAKQSSPAPRDVGSRSEATRTAILQAALRVFSSVGFEAASTRQIATEANAHHALLRYHFENKEALWRAAIAFMFAQQAQELTALYGVEQVDPSTSAGMKEMVRQYVRYCARHPEHAQILVHEAVADSPRLEWVVNEFIRANVQGFAAPLSEHTAAGHTRLSDSRLSGIILSAASQMVFVLAPHLRRVFREDVTRPEFVERFADAMVTLLFND